MSTTTTVFLVRLENNRFYVGASVDPQKAYLTLCEGLGGAWTTLHRPLELMEMYPGVPVTEVDTIVRKQMDVRGIENVRGGSWEAVTLTDADLDAIRHHSSAITPPDSCLIQ